MLALGDLLRQKKFRILVIIILVGVLLRAWAAWQLPIDFDEPVYLKAGQDYAALIKAGNWNGVIDYPQNTEHPPLIKLFYGLPQVISKYPLTPAVVLYSGRAISALFGSLAVGILALVNPIAGGLLAIDTLSVKYTSQAYLEAWPSLMMLVAIFSLVKMKTKGDRWFWISAAALGATVAGKFSYAPIIVVILYLLVWERKCSWLEITGYLAATAVIFLLLDPMLWHNPLGRLYSAILFHEQYTQGTAVTQAAYPWYQPVVWLSQSVPWHPNVIFWGFDGLIFLFGLAGLYWEWRDRRWLAIWFASGLLFLLLWPTKWPQYTLLIIPPLCLSASAMGLRVVKKLGELDLYWDWIQMMLIKPPRWLWVTALSFAVLLVGAKVGYEIQLAILREGWSVIDSQSSPLPSNAIYDLKLATDNQIVMATGGGVVFWQEPPKHELSGNWQIFTPSNSPLPSELVMKIVNDPKGGWWFATDAGLVYFDNQNWRIFRAHDMGLAGDSVHALAIDSEGHLWVGTTSGLAEYDNNRWIDYTVSNSNIINNAVLSMTIEKIGSTQYLWIGTLKGISRLDIDTGVWKNFLPEDTSIGWGGIDDMMVDSQGRIWASSLGAGVSIWDGVKWDFLRVSNSDIPVNTVIKVVETKPGLYWLATAASTSSGGILVRYNGQKWQQYTPDNSGYSGSEPLAIILDQDGHLLIGTRTGGLVIFQNP